MRTLSKENVIYTFSAKNQPIFSVEPGEIFQVETDDCFRSQIQQKSDLVTSIDFSQVNPATGPIEIKGAQAGDLLIVDILDLEVGKQGIMVALPEHGAFGHRLQETVTKVVPVVEQKFVFNDTLSFPLTPMIGVIGVAPAEKEVPTGEIDDHGGNMDAKVIRKGARLYFHVQTNGALLALGDAHAGMGDGEALICGVEATAKVTLQCDLLKAQNFVPQRPVVEVNGIFATIAHGETLDDAAAKALDDMADLLRAKSSISEAEAAMLISAVGDLKVCQIVDPQKTARVEMPKAALGLQAEDRLFA